MRSSVLGVIPARGGSKRVPRKNIRNVGGLPLIAHTIAAANKARLLDDVLVSTDDSEIQSVALKYGGNAPFLRPKHLSGDEVTNAQTLIHALKWKEMQHNRHYDMVMLLQPTSPIRNPEHIDAAITALGESNATTLASVKGPFKKRNPNLKLITNRGQLQDYKEIDDEGDWPAFYIYNASIYLVKTEHLFKTESFVSKNEIPLIMDAVHSVDLDEELDFVMAESIFSFLDKK